MQSLEERVAALEQAVFSRDRKVGRDDWKTTLGMFDDDPMMKEIIDEALRIREEERRLARIEFETESAE
jgi:hypothetical protein